MTFPIRGGYWAIPRGEDIEAWELVYRFDVMAELEKARLWLEANPSRRKTARGMPRFLVGWLNKAARDSRRQVTPAAVDAPRSPAEPLWFASRECPHPVRCASRAACQAKEEAE